MNRRVLVAVPRRLVTGKALIFIVLVIVLTVAFGPQHVLDSVSVFTAGLLPGGGHS
jgi:hypothetical protein